MHIYTHTYPNIRVEFLGGFFFFCLFWLLFKNTFLNKLKITFRSHLFTLLGTDIGLCLVGLEHNTQYFK